MTFLMKAEDKIVDPEIFRPEVLTDEQNFQTFILVYDLRKQFKMPFHHMIPQETIFGIFF
jgi:hypothetical protein